MTTIDPTTPTSSPEKADLDFESAPITVGEDDGVDGPPTDDGFGGDDFAGTGDVHW